MATDRCINENLESLLTQVIQYRREIQRFIERGGFIENRRKLLGDRIREARARLSFTQQVLADQAGFSSSQIVSQIEKGQRDVKAWELFYLAKALRLDVSQLLAVKPPEALSRVLWRKSPSSRKEIIEAEFLQSCHQYSLVEKLCECAGGEQLPTEAVDLGSMSYGKANSMGERMWQDIGLGSRPACALRSVLEDKYRVKVWYDDLGEDTSAASTWGDFGPAVLINAREAPWRRNFSFAHELFHLVTWGSIEDDDIDKDANVKERVETLANAFAAGILLPAGELKKAFLPRIQNGKVKNTDLIEVAREFDVSTEALLYRLANLGYVERDDIRELLDNPDFRSLDRSFRVGEWGKPPSLPERFVRLAFVAYQMGNLSRPRLAELLRTSLAGITETLMEYGLDDRADYSTEVRASGR